MTAMPSDQTITAPDGLSNSLVTSLKVVSERAPNPADDWVIIGSAAAALIGADIEPEDVDVLASRYTIDAFLAALKLPASTRPADGVFRSAVFQRTNVRDGIPIEFMGDMMLMHENSRSPLAPKTRVKVNGLFGTVFVPNPQEQIAILRRFGRAKDLARIPLIDAVCI